MFSRLLLFLLMLNAFAGISQETSYVIKKDLSTDWLVFSNDDYVSAADEDEFSTLYIRLRLDNYRHDKLLIESESPFRVFIEGQLQPPTKKQSKFSCDSIRKVYGPNPMIAIHFSHKTKDIRTLIITDNTNAVSESDIQIRQVNGARDFVIVVGLILIVLLIGLIRFNPRLTIDYFSVTKMLSLRESDDIQTYTKLTGINILFYLLVSFSGALFLVTLASAGLKYQLLQGLIPHSFVNALMIWLRMSSIIFGLLILKAILTYGLSFLFGIADSADIHVFNSLRILLLLSLILMTLAGLYFIVRGTNPGVYTFLFQSIVVLLVAWLVFMYFKMSNRLSCSAFHLFSYLCATEIVTLIVLSKVLYQ